MLKRALRAGVNLLEFWEMTPRETAQVIEAAWWRWDRERERLAWQSWQIAALSRAKRLPPLSQVVHGGTRKLSKAEAAQRRAMHQAAAARMNQPEMQARLIAFMEQRKPKRDRKARHRQRPDSGRPETTR